MDLLRNNKSEVKVLSYWFLINPPVDLYCTRLVQFQVKSICGVIEKQIGSESAVVLVKGVEV
jgi:hypothetical protein